MVPNPVASVRVVLADMSNLSNPAEPRAEKCDE